MTHKVQAAGGVSECADNSTICQLSNCCPEGGGVEPEARADVGYKSARGKICHPGAGVVVFYRVNLLSSTA